VILAVVAVSWVCLCWNVGWCGIVNGVTMVWLGCGGGG